MWRDSSWRGRVRLGILTALVLVLSIAPAAISQQGLPTLPTGTTPSGAGNGLAAWQLGTGDPLGYITPNTSWGIVNSHLSLADVDPISGALLANDVASPHGGQLAAANQMMAQSQLAFDASRLAQQAREQAERKKEQARQQGIAVDRAPNPGTPEPWELKGFSECGSPSNTSWQARIEVVDAFEQMCQDAAAEGVALKLNSAYRSPARQKVLFDQAIGKYGSASAARKWVAWSDGTNCTSRHCSGAALDIANNSHSWMHAPVGCYGAGQVDLSTTSCGPGEVTVIRANMYLFVFPLSHEPWHAESGIAITTTTAGANAGYSSCDPARSLSVPEMIGAIWRCRLAESGYPQERTRQVVAEALVVSKCESSWSTDAVVFAGRYRDTPHPSTGHKYSAAGVFQFIRATADSWIRPGGYANVHDPVANIDAAARLWISNDQAGRDAWAPWACAKVNDGFAKKSVLPGYPGGPASLPAWAYNY